MEFSRKINWNKYQSRVSTKLKTYNQMIQVLKEIAESFFHHLKITQIEKYTQNITSQSRNTRLQ